MTVVILILEGIEGALNVVAHQVLVLATLAGGRGIDQTAAAIREPGRHIHLQSDINVCPCGGHDERGIQLHFLVGIQVAGEGEGAAVPGAGRANADGGEIGMRGQEGGVGWIEPVVFGLVQSDPSSSKVPVSTATLKTFLDARAEGKIEQEGSRVDRLAGVLVAIIAVSPHRRETGDGPRYPRPDHRHLRTHRR
jgi:hypothetical protein